MVRVENCGYLSMPALRPARTIDLHRRNIQGGIFPAIYSLDFHGGCRGIGISEVRSLAAVGVTDAVIVVSCQVRHSRSVDARLGWGRRLWEDHTAVHSWW